jgi:hypothetical protein
MRKDAKEKGEETKKEFTLNKLKKGSWNEISSIGNRKTY